MILLHAFLSINLLVSQSPCTGTPIEGSGNLFQSVEEVSVRATTESEQEPAEQLAQYPGAPFEDEAGHLWFATVTKGILRYDGEEFVNFTTEDGLAGNMVRGIVSGDNGELWIGTNGGVSVYDGKTFKTLTDYGDIEIVRTFSEIGDHRDIWEILRDSKGTWWIATLGGVFRYDGKAFATFPMPAVAKAGAYEFSPKMVYEIYESPDGALWFATDGVGAVRYDGTQMTTYTKESHGLCSDRICTILQDSRGDFWFGTSDGGVSRYDGKTFTTHFRSPTFSKHTGWGRFMAIYEDRKGHVWFGVSSQGGGVHRFDGKDFRYFTEKDGLGAGGVPSIGEDRQGNLWFGTTSGVFRFDGQKFINFTKEG